MKGHIPRFRSSSALPREAGVRDDQRENRGSGPVSVHASAHTAPEPAAIWEAAVPAGTAGNGVPERSSAAGVAACGDRTRVSAGPRQMRDRQMRNENLLLSVNEK